MKSLLKIPTLHWLWLINRGVTPDWRPTQPGGSTNPFAPLKATTSAKINIFLLFSLPYSYVCGDLTIVTAVLLLPSANVSLCSCSAWQMKSWTGSLSCTLRRQCRCTWSTSPSATSVITSYSCPCTWRTRCWPLYTGLTPPVLSTRSSPVYVRPRPTNSQSLWLWNSLSS